VDFAGTTGGRELDTCEWNPLPAGIGPELAILLPLLAGGARIRRRRRG